MTAAYLGAAEPGTPEWGALRRPGLGGSEVAAALGLSPWCSPFTLWHRKRGDLPPEVESESMRWGKLLEPLILGEWLRRHNRTPPATLNPSMWIGDGWRIASPDLLDEGLIVEAKTADGNDYWEWGTDNSDAPDAIPIHYRIQILWYGDVLNIRNLHCAVLLGGNQYRQYQVPWDQGEVDDIRTRAEAFWRTVVDGQRPALDSSDSTYATVRQLHPAITLDEAEIPAEALVAWEEGKAVVKAHTAQVQAAKAVIADAMGTAKWGTVAGRRVVRRQTRGNLPPWPVLLEDREAPA